jgi:hypothetical protein
MLTVIVPWRPQPSREAAFEALQRWYAEALPHAVIRTVDSDDEVFNLSRCRNLGVTAITDPDEVVVINDADTIPELRPLLEAIAAAKTSGLVHLPYDRYHWLGRMGTAQLIAGTNAADCEFELVNGARSGVYVTTPATWWAHGGQDEQFRGWGFEDSAWYVAHETLLGEAPRRHSGTVYALHHETQLREGPQYDLNAARMNDYLSAASDPVRMRALVGGSLVHGAGEPVTAE